MESYKFCDRPDDFVLFQAIAQESPCVRNRRYPAGAVWTFLYYVVQICWVWMESDKVWKVLFHRGQAIKRLENVHRCEFAPLVWPKTVTLGDYEYGLPEYVREKYRLPHTIPVLIDRFRKLEVLTARVEAAGKHRLYYRLDSVAKAFERVTFNGRHCRMSIKSAKSA